jgi:hypothetical protein
MECAVDFEFKEDLGKDDAPEAAGIGETGTWASAFSAWRRELDASNTHPANSRTNTAPNTGSHTRLLPAFLAELFPALLPDKRPFPITLFLRINQITLERVDTTLGSVLTLRRRNRPLLTSH